MQIFDYIPRKNFDNQNSKTLKTGALLISLGMISTLIVPFISDSFVKASSKSPPRAYGATSTRTAKSSSPSNTRNAPKFKLTASQKRKKTLATLAGVSPDNPSSKNSGAPHPKTSPTAHKTNSSPTNMSSTPYIKRLNALIPALQRSITNTKKSILTLKNQKAALEAKQTALTTNTQTKQNNAINDVYNLQGTTTTIANQSLGAINSKVSKDQHTLTANQKALTETTEKLAQANLTLTAAQKALALATQNVTPQMPSYQAAVAALAETKKQVTSDNTLLADYKRKTEILQQLEKNPPPQDEGSLGTYGSLVKDYQNREKQLTSTLKQLAKAYLVDSAYVNAWDAVHAAQEKVLGDEQAVQTQTNQQTQLSQTVKNNENTLSKDQTLLNTLTYDSNTLSIDQEQALAWHDAEDQTVLANGSESSVLYYQNPGDIWTQEELSTTQNIVSTDATFMNANDLSSVDTEEKSTSSVFGNLLSNEAATDEDLAQETSNAANLKTNQTALAQSQDSLVSEQNQESHDQKQLDQAQKKVSTLESQAHKLVTSWIDTGNPTTLKRYNALVAQINGLNQQIYDLSGIQRANFSTITAPIPSNSVLETETESLSNQMHQDELQERLASESLLDSPVVTPQIVEP